MNTDVASEMTKYGNVLPTMYAPVPSGAIRTCSMVPRSFSRTTDSDVETTAEIMPMYAMRPGMRNTALLSCGLYQTRDSTLIGRSEERRVGKECRSRGSPYH